MMHGRGKSDSAIVAVKPTNKAERSAAELVEPRVGTKGNADWQSRRRTQSRESLSQALGRIRQMFRRQNPRWEPDAGKPHVGSVRGARSNPRPTATRAVCCAARVSCWPIARATAADQRVRLLGYCGLSLVLAARNRVPCPPASAIGASPAVPATKLGGC
jgi:hypothetical protein